MIMAFFVIFEFDAQATARHGVLCVACDRNKFFVFNMKHHAAGVWAIVWATAMKGLYIGINRLVHFKNIPRID